MPLNITRRDIEEAQNYARDAMRATSRDYSGGGSQRTVGGTVRQTLGVGVGAVGVGILTGRFGPLNFGGNPIPLDLAAGVGLHLTTFLLEAFAGISLPKDVNNVADGAIGGYLTKFGVGYGTSLRKAAGKPPLNLTDIAGEERSAGRATPAQLQQGNLRAERARNKGPLTEAELVAMAQAVR